MLKRFLIVVTIFTLALIPLLFRRNVEAAALTTLSDTLTRLDNSTLSSHDILFNLPAAETFDAGQTITYDFNEDGSDWAVDAASSVIADFDFTTVKSASPTEAVILDVAVGAPDCTGESGANDIAIGIVEATGVVSVEACSTFSSTDTASTINLEYGTVATDNGSGTNKVTNPAGTGSTVLAIDHASGTNTGSLAVPIMTSDQVTVSATVDPSITSTLGGAGSPTCSLGTLTIATVYGCTYTNTVVTNASSGFASTIVEVDGLKSGTDEIDEVTDGTVNAAAEEYGVSSDDATDTPDIADYDGTCGTAATEAGSAITLVAKEYSNESAPVSSDVTNICHAAGVSGITPAGSYSHVVTHITTGTF